MPSRVALLAVVYLLASGVPEARAQHFGKNKVEYVDFDYKILETEHFAVYHYPSEEPAARLAARLAERWYARLSRALEHQLEDRQPLVLYGSHPEFAQTNVINGFLAEGIGGVTESTRRRIVMPFAPTLGETDRILGHELTHAFQMDMAGKFGGGLGWQLWAVEGLAQYLAFGARDADTAMWLRDAVVYDLLPERQSEAAGRFSPYRYGHAMWAYMAGRFGSRIIPEILKAKNARTLAKRIKAATGLELDAIYADWRTAAIDRFAPERGRAADASASPLLPSKSPGRLHLGPSISPDGRRVVFFSERDRLSLDLYLADVASGTIVRKLATTTASARFESLQAIRSAGSWSPEGDSFVFGAIERGKPSLVVIDMNQPQRRREIRLPQFGEVLSPSWSPDGRAIAFSALEGGVTNLYIYDLHSGALTQLTDDPYADLHAAWSPDGKRIAFVTDRFSTDLESLRFGPTELALADLQSGAIERIEAIGGSAHFNPQWSADGRSIYFVSDAGGVTNIHRIAPGSGEVTRLTDEGGGVEGLTPTSPALSVARSAAALAFTRYRNAKYQIAIKRGADAVTAPASESDAGHDVTTLPPLDRADTAVEALLDDGSAGLSATDELRSREYGAGLSLEAIGPPYISSGGGPFGTFFRAGGSLLFSDFLGERRLGVFAQAGNHLSDLAVVVQYLNRERRWNWGASAEVLPTLRRLPRMRSGTVDDTPVSMRETHYFERMQFRAAGLLAYPFDRAQRIEIEAGVRHSAYRESVSAVARSLSNGRVVSRTVTTPVGGAPATSMEATAAYVRDTAVFGPTGPILGGRSRVEVTSTFGDLAATRILLDHRRYVMPIRPYTFATRVLHLGQYGPDANDERLLPTFLGSRTFVRGYGWESIRCRSDVVECAGYNQLLGSRLLIGNLEVRAPLLGVRSRDLRYGPVPAEAFIFGDAGFVWARAPEFAAAAGAQHLVRSFGIGVRLNAFGFPIEWTAVRATDRPSVGWSFGLSFTPAF